ncbi:MAG: cation:proton antiporter [Spirochaetales bacterium]|nr:cation:proton antiporter [Spirochaetales bacterium]
MEILNTIQSFFTNLHLPLILIIGTVTFIGLFFGKTMKYIKLPSIIGFMIIGVVLGPSLLDILNEPVMNNLSFITEIALGFVALGIGLELHLKALKEQGKSIILIIISESFMAFIVVTAVVYVIALVSPVPDHIALPLALLFGSIAPASAPAGTVAVIKEYNARGSLTKALYAVVGFDDGLGIIIFGFAAAIAKSLLESQTGNTSNMMTLIVNPLMEIGLSLGIGCVFGVLLRFIVKKLHSNKDIFIVIFAFVFIITGICEVFHLSVILTNMVTGIMLVNLLDNTNINRIGEELSNVLPLLFILFFTLAGSNLNVYVLPSLGLIGIVYVLSRSFGLMSGAWLGACIGGAEPKIKKFLGMGILSQAGVAIGLSLIVKQRFDGIGADNAGGIIGTTIITTITATSIIFEIIGPILTKIALQKAGEIRPAGK